MDLPFGVGGNFIALEKFWLKFILTGISDFTYPEKNLVNHSLARFRKNKQSILKRGRKIKTRR